MKRIGCVLTIGALLALSPFYFIQAPSNNSALHDYSHNKMGFQKAADTTNQASLPEIPVHAPASYLSTISTDTAFSNPTLVCFFSHGIADTYRQAQKYVHQYKDVSGVIHTNQRYTIAAPTRAFNYPDATQRFWRVNFWRTNLAQDADVLTLKRALEQLKKQSPRTEVILYGVSRGASTIVNFMAEYNTEIDSALEKCGMRASTLPRIKAVVLESPFDDIASVARHLAQRVYIDTLPYGARYGQQAVQSIIGTIFINYNKNGLTPIKSASLMPKDIPTLIICSEQDQLVPCWSSQALYQALQESGHKNVHILKLKKGLHAQLLSGPEGEDYQQTVHAFYKQCGLPYNKNLIGN